METEQDHAPDEILDVTGYRCPIPVLKLRKAVSNATSGTRILVHADDPIAGVDIPHFCAEQGHALIRQSRDGRCFSFLVEVHTHVRRN